MPYTYANYLRFLFVMYQLDEISSLSMTSLAINGLTQYVGTGFGLATNSTMSCVIEIIKKPLFSLFETFTYIQNGGTTIEKLWRGVKVTTTLSLSAIGMASYNIPGNIAIASVVCVLINHMDEAKQLDRARRVTMLAFHLSMTNIYGSATTNALISNPNWVRCGQTSIQLIAGLADLGIESLHMNHDCSLWLSFSAAGGATCNPGLIALGAQFGNMVIDDILD